MGFRRINALEEVRTPVKVIISLHWTLIYETAGRDIDLWGFIDGFNATGLDLR